MYFDVFDVNTSSKTRIRPKYTIIHPKYIYVAPPDFRKRFDTLKTANTWLFEGI